LMHKARLPAMAGSTIRGIKILLFVSDYMPFLI
jgi:predicted phosphohydrolase